MLFLYEQARAYHVGFDLSLYKDVYQQDMKTRQENKQRLEFFKELYCLHNLFQVSMDMSCIANELRVHSAEVLRVN